MYWHNLFAENRVVPVGDSTARGTLLATSSIISSFATSCRMSPQSNLDAPLRAHIRRCIKVVAVDSAANETLASELMREPAIWQPLTPNMALLIRDGAHGARRLASQPFAAVAALSEVARRFARGKRSPGQLIHFSKELFHGIAIATVSCHVRFDTANCSR